MESLSLHRLYDITPALRGCEKEITRAAEQWIETYRRGGKLLLCGNGGSAADCIHIAGELEKGFLKKRPLQEEQKQQMLEKNPALPPELLTTLQVGLPALPLVEGGAILTAFANDCHPDMIYAQRVLAWGKPGDCLVAISTSGNAKNCCYAAHMAKAMGLTTLGLTGQGGGKLAEICDITIRVPEKETFRVQELHLPVYHALCAAVEEEFFQK